DGTAVDAFVGAHPRLAVRIRAAPPSDVVDRLPQIEGVEPRARLLGVQVEYLEDAQRCGDVEDALHAGDKARGPVVELGRQVETGKPVPARRVTGRARTHARIVARSAHVGGHGVQRPGSSWRLVAG